MVQAMRGTKAVAVHCSVERPPRQCGAPRNGVKYRPVRGEPLIHERAGDCPRILRVVEAPWKTTSDATDNIEWLHPLSIRMRGEYENCVFVTTNAQRAGPTRLSDTI